MKCNLCEIEMENGLDSWHFKCTSCSLESSKLKIAINEENEINEKQRENALKNIRKSNNIIILNLIKKYLVSSNNNTGQKKLLDVGCAHGWFMEDAIREFDCYGIEPDLNIVNKTKEKKLKIREGYFPEALEKNECFDIIIFNDVLEHIPDIKNAMKFCFNHLNINGIVLINAPNSHGNIYKISKALAYMGFKNSFNRMWQYSMPSPHMHYLNTKSIVKMCETTRFKLKAEENLKAIKIKGLYERINYVGGNKFINQFKYFIILLIIPLLQYKNTDISVWILKK